LYRAKRKGGDVNETIQRHHILRELANIFGDRLRHLTAEEHTIAVVCPVSVEEVEALSRIAGRHAVPLVAEGAGTMRRFSREGIVVRFDLMRQVSVPKPPHYRLEAQPGVTWQELDDHLRRHGRSLRVHPTSAPRSTVGGWVALDGLGVGSYEHGWLSENVVSADLVLPGGYRALASGSELPLVRPTGSIPAIIVSVKLETRPLERDIPFAVAFDDPVEISRAALALHDRGLPLWHLGLQNAGMSRSRGHGEKHILFGAYPGERADLIEVALWSVFRGAKGNPLPPAEAYRVWGTRHFPVSPAGRAPGAAHVLLPLRGLGEFLSGVDGERVALQGSIGGAGEALLLAFGREGDREPLGSLDPGDKERLMRSALEGGGREHRYWAT
jgi:glycolate oxidase